MKFPKLLAVIAAIALFSSVAMAQKSGLATDTQHGAVGTTPCGSCHTPHTGTNGNTLLWVHSIGTTTYTTYTSPTMDNATAPFTAPGDGNLTAGDPENNTLLCMSCHDGALAVTNGVTRTTTTYGTVGGSISTSNPSIDIGGTATLTNDHPVNMTYDPVADTGLDTVANVTGVGLVLYDGGGATNTVQCGSCHDPHKQGPDGGPGAGYYLRKTNVASALCLTCHL